MKSNRTLFNLLVIASILLSSLAWLPSTGPVWGDTGTIRYVRPGGTGNCGDWEHTCGLQTALEASGAGDEIWVTEGTYSPGPVGDRTATFQLKNGVALYGGFKGTETTREQRSWLDHTAVLSGDLKGDDGPDFANNAENSYHVVTGSGTDGTAVLDGFTITAGNANGSYQSAYGGGLCNDSGSPTLTHVTFIANSAEYGGGMSNRSSSRPTLNDATFFANAAGSNGGGMYNYGGSSPALTQAAFYGNKAMAGGGMNNLESSSPTLTSIIFFANSASNFGGGITNFYMSSPTLTNVIFFANSAVGSGGGMGNAYFSNPILTNVTFSANQAPAGGGLANSYASHPTVTNSILWGNMTGDPPVEIAGDSAVVTFSDIQGGYAGTGNIAIDPRFTDSAGGNLHLLPGSPAIEAGDNAAVPGGVTTDLEGKPRLLDYDHDGVARVDMGAFEVPPVFFVDHEAAGPTHDGYSWASAFTGLQDALALSGFYEIWVAEGTYTPGPVGDRNATFQLKNGVGLYGGFTGSETTRDQRSWLDHAAVLSGDLNGDDGPGFANNGENSYHVVTGSGTDGTAVLDGFTITAGNANSTSAANQAYYGGGMYNVSGSPTLSNLTFSANQANVGGGMFNFQSSSPTLTHATFSANSAVVGGGMGNDTLSNPTLTNVSFSANSASSSGGGMYNYTSSPMLTNVKFTANQANVGGGMINETGSDPTLTHVTFYANIAGNGAGGVYNNSSRPILTNSILWGNTAGGDLRQIGGSAATVTFSDIQGDYDGNGNIDADPRFVNAAKGDLRLRGGSPAIDAASPDGCPTADIIDLPRPVDGNLDGIAACDMGAYEFQLLISYLPSVRK
jgi:hypothetical protein